MAFETRGLTVYIFVDTRLLSKFKVWSDCKGFPNMMRYHFFCNVIALFAATFCLSFADNFTTDYPCLNCSSTDNISDVPCIFCTTSFIHQTDASDVPCNKECHNGGTCFNDEDGDSHCKCAHGYEGSECEEHTGESKIDSKQTLVLVASLFGMIGIFLILLAVLLLLHHFSRKSKERQAKMESISKSLNDDFTSVNKKLEELSMEGQMQLLTRLSKLIDATARAALMTYPNVASGDGQSGSKDAEEGRKSRISSRISLSSFRRFSAPHLLDPVSEEEERSFPPMSPRESMRFTSI